MPYLQVESHILRYSIPAFETTSSPDCQLSFFEILSETWQLHPQLQDHLRGPLLNLLNSSSADLQKRVLRFWNGVLPATLSERLVSLIKILTDLEHAQVEIGHFSHSLHWRTAHEQPATSSQTLLLDFN